MPELPGGTVTFLITDVEGSTRRWELEPVAMRSAIAHHDSVLAQAVAAAGGTLIRSSLAVARAALPDPDAEFESGRRIGLDAAIGYALEPA